MRAILGIAGAPHAGSPSHLALAVALGAAREHGARVVTIELSALSLPLFEASDAPLPAGAQALRAAVAAASGVIVAAPEVNGSYAPMLANALAWLGTDALRGRAAGLIGAADGIGAVKALSALSLVLAYMGALVLPMPAAVGGGAAAFGADGAIIDARLEARVKDVGRGVAAFLSR